MRKVLFVTASLMGEKSTSRKIALELIDSFGADGSVVQVQERPVDDTPHLTADALAALGTPADQRTATQQAFIARADGLIEELEEADVLVIAAPMYNFSIPSTLKSWIDHLARAGRTFRYTEQGPQGLLTGKKAYVVLSRGGYYSGESPVRALDFQEPYLRAVLGFIGITDVTFIHVEGQSISKEAAEKGLQAARQQVSATLSKAA
jgi:FMN-dependent NADH-azoreductase